MVAFTRRLEKFELGRIVATSNALAALSAQEINNALARHHAGDWGEMCDEDCAVNNLGLVEHGRLFSEYRTATGVKFWIITEWDRSVTTVLLPEDY